MKLFKNSVFLVASLLIASCGGGGGGSTSDGGTNPKDNIPTIKESILGLDSSSLDYGLVNINTTKEMSFIVKNTGEQSKAITASVLGTGYSISSDTCAGLQLNKDETCIVKVAFSSNVVGTRNGTLQIKEDNTIKVTGSLTASLQNFTDLIDTRLVPSLAKSRKLDGSWDHNGFDIYRTAYIAGQLSDVYLSSLSAYDMISLDNDSTAPICGGGISNALDQSSCEDYTNDSLFDNNDGFYANTIGDAANNTLDIKCRWDIAKNICRSNKLLDRTQDYLRMIQPDRGLRPYDDPSTWGPFRKIDYSADQSLLHYHWKKTYIAHDQNNLPDVSNPDTNLNLVGTYIKDTEIPVFYAGSTLETIMYGSSDGFLQYDNFLSSIKTFDTNLNQQFSNTGSLGHVLKLMDDTPKHGDRSNEKRMRSLYLTLEDMIKRGRILEAQKYAKFIIRAWFNSSDDILTDTTVWSFEKPKSLMYAEEGFSSSNDISNFKAATFEPVAFVGISANSCRAHVYSTLLLTKAYDTLSVSLTEGELDSLMDFIQDSFLDFEENVNNIWSVSNQVPVNCLPLAAKMVLSMKDIGGALDSDVAKYTKLVGTAISSNAISSETDPYIYAEAMEVLSILSK